MLELNEVLIYIFVAVSLRINAILTQFKYEKYSVLAYNEWCVIKHNQTKSNISKIHVQRGYGIENLQSLICHKNPTKPTHIYSIYIEWRRFGIK